MKQLTLRLLQEQQLEHDKKCHRDIFFMSHQDRFKHIALHYGKYSKRLADIILHQETKLHDAVKIVHKTLVDTMIMVINAGELLQIDFEYELDRMYGGNKSFHLESMDLWLFKENKALFDFLSDSDFLTRVTRLMLELVSIAGFMQKSAEELDHMYGIPREQIKKNTINLLVLLFVAGKIFDLNYNDEIQSRWKEIQEKVIL